MRLLMVAPPGAGKGTQSRLLAEHYRITHISSGELFRREVSAGTEIGRKAAEYLRRGDLVPDELVLEMLAGPILEAAEHGGFVLDGFPRTLPQAEEAYRIARELEGVELQAVVHLQVPRDELMRRLLARAGTEDRSDDDARVIEHRLDVYDSETAPMIDFYAGRGLVVEVDGSRSIEEVFDAIVGEVNELRAGLS
jgi:adenylate kinase